LIRTATISYQAFFASLVYHRQIIAAVLPGIDVADRWPKSRIARVHRTVWRYEVQNLACHHFQIARSVLKPFLELGTTSPPWKEVKPVVNLAELLELPGELAGELAAGAAGVEHPGDLVGLVPKRIDAFEEIGERLRIVVGDNPFQGHVEQLGPFGQQQTVCEYRDLETGPNKVTGERLDIRSQEGLTSGQMNHSVGGVSLQPREQIRHLKDVMRVQKPVLVRALVEIPLTEPFLKLQIVQVLAPFRFPDLERCGGGPLGEIAPGHAIRTGVLTVVPYRDRDCKGSFSH
jgi:hypothetical protein